VRRGPRLAGVAALAVAAVLAAGCSGHDPAPTPSRSAPPASTRAAGTTQAAYTLPTCPRLPRQPVRKGGLPDLTLPCLGGGPKVRLSDLRGRPTVLNVWAAWCEICATEMPVLAAGMRRAGDKVRFFGIHYKAPEKYGEQSAADFGVGFPSVQDTDGDRTTIALRPLAGPPQTFFYAADGSLTGRWPGRITSQKQLDALVQRYLGVRL
jgi:cytochrome c biogenesis protein CcmG, thiol:disulfide interchange protein DsbE